MANGKGKGTSGKESAWADLLRAAGQRLVPLVVSTGSLLTFVAFAGAVIVWTRLNAVEVAPDQAITAFPRGELVAIGASLLLLYGFFGALAVLGAFLIDRGGRPTQGMIYGLLFLLIAEGISAISLAAEFATLEWNVAVLLFVFAAGFVMWIASLGRLSELRDELHVRPMETRAPLTREGLLRPRTGKKKLDSVWIFASYGIAAFAAVAAVLVLALHGSEKLLLFAVGVPAALFFLVVLGLFYADSQRSKGERKKVRETEETETEHLAAQENAWVGLQIGLPDREEWNRWRSGAGKAIEDLRMATRRPYRLYLTWRGTIAILIALAAAAALPAWSLGEAWVGGAIAAAAVIAMWLWRVAIFTRDKLIWFGLAVFLSVPLFGTVMTMARNLDDPQIQPIALIRSTDGSDEAIQGLYVTEAKDRVYFATVATEGCTGSLRHDSGRLLWVPKDEVVAMSIGPLQSVEAAAKTSLEMAFALTPAVETPSGERVNLTPGESRSEEGGLGEEAPLTVQRLENVGPAVRPTFGRGVKVEPVDARPGELVTLTMSTPIEDGFGKRRDGRSLRVGGVPARILVNPTIDAARAEYAWTEDGDRLVLDKKKPGVYVRDDDGTGFVQDDDASGSRQRFVRLAEGSGVVATSVAGDGPDGFYLRLQTGEGPDRIAVRQTVSFRDGREGVALDSGLWRQAWNKDEIKFYVPEKGTSATVTVDCEQLAGQPLLRVERPPQAQLAVRPVSSGRALALDGHRSSDDGKIEARRWSLDGHPLQPTDGAEAGTTSRAKIGPRPGRHRVRLAVEDDQHEVGSATLYVLRLGDAGVLDSPKSARMKHLRALLVRLAGGEEAASEIWVYGFGGGHGTGARKELAEEIEKGLLTTEAADRAGLDGDGVRVNVSALAGDCGRVAGGSARRHLDIFVAVEGVRMLRPRGCPPRPAKTIEWAREEDTSASEPPARKDLLVLLADAVRRLAGVLEDAASEPGS